ncbi:5498_t:CDS:2 [Paraglomus brasilianum]|uniref:NudC domain-containing protein 1 n=1 Tax=Paraglomus brasilianum TaxID=144538 RepID=A0A9N9FVP3_9GLOM|nr:5498_t:CDS:2 [Paraglomus brasilianum]
MPFTGIPTTVQIRPNRDLLNPTFEGYKLKLLNEDECIIRTDLPAPGISIQMVPSGTQLSYKEVQSRVLYNHLFSGYNLDEGKGAAFYFDSDLRLVLVEYNSVKSNTVTTHNLTEISKSVSDTSNKEYPSLRALSPTLVLVSDGSGGIYLVKLIENSDFPGYRGEIICATAFYGHVLDDNGYEFVSDLKPTPCVLLDAKIIGEGENAYILYMVYNTAFRSNPTSEDIQRGAIQTLFDVSLVELAVKPPYRSQIVNALRGPDIPLYCSIDSHGDGYVIGSTIGYEVLRPTETRQQGELDKQKRNQSQSSSAGEQKPPPYVWQQTSSDVTVCFQLPHGTPGAAINYHFTRTHLSLTVNLSNNPPAPSSTTETSIPQYVFTPFFDFMEPESSLWTIETKIGLLTLHIEKKHHGTRWTHVFQHDDGVLETLDPNEFAEFRERLERYTTGMLDDGGPESFNPLQHPIGHEIEESIDYEGQSVIFAWVDREGVVGAKTIGSDHEFLCRQFEHWQKKDQTGLPSVCLKHDVDGLVYAISHNADNRSSTSTSSSPLAIDHVATFNAFGFVQASKREKRCMYHDPNHRFVVILEGSRHAFIYQSHGPKNIHDQQLIVDVAGRASNADIIGIQMVGDGIILVLTSKHLVLINLSQE